jgi:hypothetical protein
MTWRRLGRGSVRRNCISVEVVATVVGVEAVHSLGRRAGARLVYDGEVERDMINGGGVGTKKGAAGYGRRHDIAAPAGAWW